MSDPAAETTEAVVEAELVAVEPAAEAHTLGLELPDQPDEAIAMLLGELRASRTEAGAYLDDLRRVAADFDNYRKRTTRESEAMLDRATEKVVVGLLPALDSFDAALATVAQTETEQSIHTGMLNTREQLLDTLRSHGLEVIATVDEPFDPEIHEPVGAPTGTGGDLVVTQELRRGYRLGGKVLRAALVALEAR